MNNNTQNPRHVFVSLRAGFDAIRAFSHDVLPSISEPFILVTGSEDITLPRQTDARWRTFNADERAVLEKLNNDNRLVHWYAENLDEGGSAKRSPLPVGLVFPENFPGLVSVPAVSELSSRELRVLCAHRHREGSQWHLRRGVSTLAEGPWRSFTTVPRTEMPIVAFNAELERHAFVICAEGGGMDPSPKAWSAILHGAVPIIRRTTLCDAYAHLPVVIVEDWDSSALSLSRLAKWREMLSASFDTVQGRCEVLRRLSADYWWEMIASGQPIRGDAPLAVFAG